jgi:hypothetical protein
VEDKLLIGVRLGSGVSFNFFWRAEKVFFFLVENNIKTFVAHFKVGRVKLYPRFFGFFLGKNKILKTLLISHISYQVFQCLDISSIAGIRALKGKDAFSIVQFQDKKNTFVENFMIEFHYLRF